MAILSIENIRFDDNYCYVDAIIEDAKCIKNQTLIDPPEWGPALCSTSFNIEELDIPVNEQEFMQLLEEICPAWRVIDLPYADDFEDEVHNVI
jgi:hypothetical protein